LGAGNPGLDSAIARLDRLGFPANRFPGLIVRQYLSGRSGT
jgi:hypothetical protein